MKVFCEGCAKEVLVSGMGLDNSEAYLACGHPRTHQLRNPKGGYETAVKFLTKDERLQFLAERVPKVVKK